MTTDLPARVAALAPCPFCGGPAEMRGDDAPENWISCKADCQPSGRNKEMLIAAWNRRVTGTGDDVLADRWQIFEHGERWVVADSESDDPAPVFFSRAEAEAHIEYLRGPAAPTDGWIEWKGGEKAPVDPMTEVCVRWRSGVEFPPDSAGWMQWDHTGDEDDIIAYKLAGEGGR